MDVTKILLELAVFAFFGLLYYVLQRKRIVRHGKQEVFFILENTIYKIHEFLDPQKKADFYVRLNTYVKDLENIETPDDFLRLDTLLTDIPSEFNDEITSQLREVKTQIQFFVKK